MLFPSKKKGFRTFIWNKSISLLIDYALFSILNWTLLKIFVHSPGNILLYEWGQNSLWFIPVLYLSEILHYLIIFDKRWKRWESIALLYFSIFYNKWHQLTGGL